MSPLDSGWVNLPLACLAVVLLGHWVYVQCMAGPRRGLPIPPGPSGRWFLGTPFPKSRAPFKLAELTKKYGPVFSLRHGSTLFVIIGGHQAAMEIMEKEGASLVDRPRSIAAGETLSGGMRVITSRSGDRLRRLRRVLHAVMQPKVATTYEPIQLRHAKNILLDILDDPERHQMHARGLAASVVMEIMYGKATPTSYNDPEVIAVNRCIMRFGRAITPRAYLVDTYPILQYVPGYLTQLRAWHQEELALFEGQLDIVRKQMAEGKARPCFATFLIEKQSEYQISDKEMAYLAGGMFGAGSETTASAITIMIMAAALHPDAQAIVQEELDRVVGWDRLPSFADREMLPRVTAFILETLRWRPVNTVGVAHRATKDIVWRDYVIPEGATVIGNLWAIANDLDVFPNPERFDVQRWLTAEGTLRDDLQFSAFGFGRRTCPGQHIANRSIFVSAALILWAFRLSEDPNAPIDSFGFSDTANRIADPFRVTFEPRMSMYLYYTSQIRYHAGVDCSEFELLGDVFDETHNPPTPPAMKVHVKHWSAVAQWRWNTGNADQDDEGDVCGICRVPYEGCCPSCKMPGDDCPLIWGECSHIFHMHCLLKWLGTAASKQQCPMDRRPWVTAERKVAHADPDPDPGRAASADSTASE